MQILIIGAGISGAVLARKFADDGYKVKIIEKRNHIAGNMFDKIKNGIHVQQYGPHIFHTDKKKVFDFMNRFWKLNDYKHKCNVVINDEQIPIPFNFEGIDKFFPTNSNEIKKLLIKKFGKNSRVSVFDLLKETNPLLKKLANFVYKKVFENYTKKMWAKDPKELDDFVLKRVPIAVSYKNVYFKNKYEGIPTEGYTNAINKMLDHKNISVVLNTEAENIIAFKKNIIMVENKNFDGPIIFCGQLDKLLNYKFGVLPYRSLKIDFVEIKQKNFQNVAVVNYPDHPTMTRITEYKYFLNNDVSTTVISKEYPGEFSPLSKDFNEPYYPMATSEANDKYAQYVKEIKTFDNFFLLGRLAEYKYFNMDDAIINALDKYENIVRGFYEKK